MCGIIRICEKQERTLSFHRGKDILCQLQGTLLLAADERKDQSCDALFGTEDVISSSDPCGMASYQQQKGEKEMIKKRLVELLQDAKKYIVFNILFQWISLVTQIIFVFVISDLIANLFEGIQQGYAVPLCILLGCLAVRMIADKLAVRSSSKASQDVKRILREKIYEKLLRLGPSYNESLSSAEINQVTTEGVEQLETYFGRYLPQLFYSLLAPFTLFIVLSRVSFKSSIVLLICVPLIPISIVVVQKIAKRLLSKYWGIYTGLADSFLENLQGLTTLKIYQADQMKADQMDEESETFRKITMKVLVMQLNSTSVMDIVAYGGAAIGMVVAVNEFLHGNITLASSLKIILLANEFFIPLRLLGSYFHIAMNGMAASDKIFRILDLPEKEEGTIRLTQDDIDITLENISFSYDESREILHDVSMSFPHHQLVSIVGRSGCGKSTIASLIEGKHLDFNGSIKLQGHAIQDIQTQSLLENIVLVKHDSYLFKGTVRENLLMARDADEEEMIRVLQRVDLWDYLRTQKGLETELAEKASNLSGGQRQRLAIARALLKDAPVYIFDEATSNIDIESEEIIMDVIRGLTKTKTVILISHRLANVVESDHIYMMEEGKIIEEGDHASLMKEHGSYCHLYTSQKTLENYGKGEEQYA